MEGCPFCAIVAGRAAAHVIDNDEHTLAFLDIKPLTPGHTLVVPRAHVADLWNSDGTTAAAVMGTAHRVAQRVRDVLRPDGLNLLHATRAAAFQSVFHLHLHVVPRWTTDGLTEPPWPQPPGDPRELAALAARLRAPGTGGSRGDAAADRAGNDATRPFAGDQGAPASRTTRAGLVLVVGLPGAGKTTLARHIAHQMGAVRMCPDEWMHSLGVDQRDADFRARLEALLWDRTRELLRLGVPVVNEYGLWSEGEREALRRDAAAMGVPVEMHVLDPPADELWRRVQVRNADPSADEASLTREELESSLPFWQPPTPAERARYDAPAGP